MKQITFNNVKAKNIVTGEEREIPAITGRNYDREISDINDRIDDLELFKFPNVTIIGTPTINHGQISGFSNSSYLKFPFMVDFRNHSFEIKMAFTTGSNVTNQENIFDSDFGLAFAIRSGKFVIAVSTNGTNWDLGEGVGTYSVQPNTTYYVRLGWDLTNYYLSYSLDGSAFINDINKAGTAQPYPKQIFIGVGENFTTVVNHFTGTINLNHATLQIGYEIVWSGMDDAGLSTRADVSLSNIDEAGEAKIKSVAGSVDVQINGASIVEGGVANIPIAGPGVKGVVSVTSAYAMAVTNGILMPVTNGTFIKNRNKINSNPALLSSFNYDEAVKYAMCDGKGAEWTDEEKTSAQQRIGILTLTQEEYDLIEVKNESTIYLIVG